MRPISSIELFLAAFVYSVATGGATTLVAVVLSPCPPPYCPAALFIGTGVIGRVLTSTTPSAT